MDLIIRGKAKLIKERGKNRLGRRQRSEDPSSLSELRRDTQRAEDRNQKTENRK